MNRRMLWLLLWISLGILWTVSATGEDAARIVIPSNVRSIGENAFAACDAGTVYEIPETVTSIGEHAFPDGAVIYCHDDSYAAQWAREHGLQMVSLDGPRRYALLIGQGYSESTQVTSLPGCLTDVHAMADMLASMDGTPYTVRVCTDLTAAGIEAAVRDTFSSAMGDSVCLLYYSGHGKNSSDTALRGALIGTDGNLVTMSALRSLLDRVPGDKILILDSCYSGTAISAVEDDTARSTLGMDAVNAHIIDVFSRKARSSGSGSYYVMTAAAGEEEAISSFNAATGRFYGVFTYGLLYGSGYNEKNGTLLTKMAADRDKDNAICLSEAYSYAYACALALNATQHAQVYPTGSDYMLWAKQQ